MEIQNVGEQRLLELGVPAEKARAFEARQVTLPEGAVRSTPAVPAEGQAAEQIRAEGQPRTDQVPAEGQEDRDPGFGAEAAREVPAAEVPGSAGAAEMGEGLPEGAGRYWAHIQSLERQAEALRREYPQLDLRQELLNPDFLRLTSPGVGVSVEAAYQVVHRKELQEAAARKMVNAIRSGSLRPRENGMNGQAGAVTTFDYRRATREQRNALKAHIRAEAAQGRKVYPNY